MATREVAQRPSVTGWEDDGGAAPSEARRVAERVDEEREQLTLQRQREQGRLDGGHDAGIRGEHRYPDAHQTEAERDARDTRDELKRRLMKRKPGRR